MASYSIHNALKVHMEAEAIEYIKSGGDIEAIGEFNQTPLHIACYEGITKVVKLLLSKKANVNAVDYKLWTPLHCAASASFYEICDLLINAKANVTAKTSDNNTILHYLVKGKNDASRQVKLIATVLSRGVLINEANINGETALMRGCLVGSPDCVYFLLSHGADVNVQNVLGETALHQATRSRRIEIVIALIEKGANKSLKTTDGRTAYDEAMELGQTAIAKVLETTTAIDGNRVSPSVPRMEFVAELSKQITQKVPSRSISPRGSSNSSPTLSTETTPIPPRPSQLKSANTPNFNRLSNSVPNPKQQNNSSGKPAVSPRMNSAQNHQNSTLTYPPNPANNPNRTPNSLSPSPSPLGHEKFESLKKEIIPLLELINKDLAYIRSSPNGSAIVERMQRINQMINVRPPVVARRIPTNDKNSVTDSSNNTPLPSEGDLKNLKDSNDNTNNDTPVDSPMRRTTLPGFSEAPPIFSRPKSTYESGPPQPTLIKQVSKDDLSVGLQHTKAVSHLDKTSFATIRQNKLSASIEMKAPPPRAFSPVAYYKKLGLPRPRTMSNAPSDPSMDKEIIIRNKTLDEIMCTETQYVRQLGALKSFFVQALQNEPNSNLITESEKTSIFINVEELFSVSFDLLKELANQETLPFESQGIGSTFLAFTERMQIYREYCMKQSGAMKVLQTLRTENTKFDEFLNGAKEYEECGREDLEGFLIKPFQRICRYVLLLKELIKHTPRNWADYDKIAAAIEAIDSIVREANEAKRVMDNLTKILEIQTAFDDFDLINSRQTLKFIDEGDFKEIDAKGHGQKRHFFLFNKYFVVAKPLKGGKYEKCSVIPIENCLIWDKKDGDPSCKGFKNVFQLVTTQCTDVENIKIMVSCPSSAQKEIWKNAIVEAISTGGLLY